MERLTNSVIQASKRIKTETKISSGATSVAYAAVQFIINEVNDVSNKSVLLIGTGKIGRNTCENLVKHTENKKIISSTIIRKLLEEGKLSKANTFLKRNWEIEGKVQRGRMMGQKIGFPTCNIDIGNYVIAKPGVYAVKTRINDRRKFYKGIANLGYRPTFNQKKILLEVNIFNFSGNLYNKKLSVEFLKFIRGEKKFKGISELKNQIKKDILKAKKL